MRMKVMLLAIISLSAIVYSCGASDNKSTLAPQGSPTVLAAGRGSAVSLQIDGTVLAWGDNYYGQLGNGTIASSGTPTQVLVSNGTITVPFSGATSVAAGNGFSAAVKNDGTVWTWGNNDSGQLGNGTLASSSTPTQVLISATVPFSGATSVAAGDGFTVALKTDGTVWAWGYGQLGDGTTTASTIAVQAVGLSRVVAIAAGSCDTVALKNDGTVWAWGDNADGELGVGSDFLNSSIFPVSKIPVQVAGLSGVVAIAEGDRSTFALKNDGTVWAWGANWNGQLGDGTTNNQYYPVQVPGLSGVIAISAGFRHTLALKNDGTVWAWGVNWFGQLGNNTINDSNAPVQVMYSNDNGITLAALTGVVSISAGDGFSLALKNDGTIWSWGANYSGQLGNGNITDSWTPVQVEGYPL